MPRGCFAGWSGTATCSSLSSSIWTQFRAEKFALLDQVRAIETPNHIPVTLSIGIGDGRGYPGRSVPVCQFVC